VERRRQNGTGRRNTTKYPKVLFFVHVHKSAGTLLCDLVKRNNLATKGKNCNIQTDQHCCGHTDHIQEQITYANTTRFDLVAIEREMYTAMAPDQYDYIVAFRQSQARYYSHWRHLRSSVHKSARTRPGTAAWLMHDNTTLSGLQYIQEQQRVPLGHRRARTRPNTNTIALLGTFQQWIQYQPDNWNTRIICGPPCMPKGKYRITRKLFHHVLDRLNLFRHFVFVEDFSNSFNKMADSYGWKVQHKPGVVANQRDKKKSPSAAAAAATVQLQNEKWDGMMSVLDDAIYEFAERKYKNVSQHVLWSKFTNQEELDSYFVNGPTTNNCTNACCGECSLY